jgi:hypothetical protein
VNPVVDAAKMGLVNKNALLARQQQWLFNCLQRNVDTVIGRQYDFVSIESMAEYQARVPLRDYEAYRSYIERMAAGESNVLFAGEVVAFERTSGSTKKSKLIPYSRESLQDFQIAITPWIKNLVDQNDLTSGSTYWSLSPVSRAASHTPSGVPVGLPDTAYLGDAINLMSGVSFAVPQWVAEIDNIKDWQLYTLYWLLVNDDLLFISVWSPSFLTVLIDSIADHYPDLKRLLSEGGIYSSHSLPSDNRALHRLHVFIRSGDCSVLWPRLRLVSCWADASSAFYYQQIKNRLSYATVQAKGLLMTEAVVTIPDASGKPVLAADSGFYEFVNDDTVFLAHELEPGTCYEVVVTTAGGLYRYRTADMVLCEPYRYGLPVLRFMGRSGIQSDLVGEKLTEDFVSSCLAFIPGFSMLVPFKGEKSSCYRLVLDAMLCEQGGNLATLVEQNLMHNPQYAYARKLQQLDAVQPTCIQSPLNKYLDCMTRAGVRYGDIKIPALSSYDGWLVVIDKEIQ